MNRKRRSGSYCGYGSANPGRLKELGAGRPAPERVASLYCHAFRNFGTQPLWSRRPSERPTIAQALVVAESLRREGNMATRPLAVQIVQACRAALQVAAQEPPVLGEQLSPEKQG
jgi:hypothetical protein